MFRQVANHLLNRSTTTYSAGAGAAATIRRPFSTEVATDASAGDSDFVESWKKVVPNIDPPKTPIQYMKSRPPTPSTLPSKLTVNFVLPYASELSNSEAPPATNTMALFSRGRIVSSSLFSKLIHHPPIQRSFSSSSNAYNQKSHGYQSGMMNNNPMFSLDISSQVGSCMPISMMRIGTIIHNIEMNPGQGGKLVRAAGTSAKILKEPAANKLCLIRLPSGVENLIDSNCRATIGVVSNPEHATKKLRKAGHSRWLGRRPVVRGVAMNPVDHPHGGGEGKSKSSGCRGGVSKTPWGKPTKSGFKTGPLKRRK